MKEFFTDLYNKVLEFFQQEKDEAENSKEIAQNRLKLVLMHDRAKLDAVTMEKMRLELIKVISKYVEIDEDALDLNLDGDGQAVALMVNIPVIRTKDPEEIEAEEKTAQENDETDEDTSDNENKKEDNDENNEETDEEIIEEDENSSEEKEENTSDDEETSEEEIEEVETENNEKTVLEDENIEEKDEKSSKKKND